MHHHLSSPEAGVVSVMQAASELFEVSSPGHGVLLPAWIGGSWARHLNVDRPESPYFSLR